MPWLLIAAIAMLVVSFVLMAVIAKKQQKPKPAGLEEWDFPQSEEGTPQTVVFGDCWLEGPMVLWYGNYRTIPIKAGGK